MEVDLRKDSGPGTALRPPGHKQKEKTMIFHINLATYKAGVSEEQREAGLELMRQVGANPVVKSWVVGPVPGGDGQPASRRRAEVVRWGSTTRTGGPNTTWTAGRDGSWPCKRPGGGYS